MRLCQRFPSRPQRPSGRAVRALAYTASLIAVLCAVPQFAAGQPALSATTPLREQVGTLRRSFDAGRSRLAGLVDGLKLAQTRLASLEGSEQQHERSLALHLILFYESGRNTVGGDSSSELVAGVREARAAVAAGAIQVGALSQRRAQLNEQVLEEHEQFSRAQSRLALARQPTSSSGAAQGTEVVAPAGAQPSTTRAGGGSALQGPDAGLLFPMAEVDVAPPATWSVVAGGVDIAAPADSPELAVCGGTVVLHGIGGLGPWTPVLHCDSPLAGRDYVYYGHAGPGWWAPIGTHVSPGQPVSEVGPGIIGDSTGPDLQIGFADATGSPAGSAGAQDMMRLLRAAYRG